MFNQEGKASVIIDGAYGSTGKGLIAAKTALDSPPDWATTNASANAGHTTVMADGTSFVTFHIPTATVVSGARAYLNSGSIINPQLLRDEMEATHTPASLISIHPHATVIMPEDIEYENRLESGATKIASTRKGVGRALARKVMRESALAKDHPMLKGMIQEIQLNHLLNYGASVQVEVPQGYDLSLSGKFYPNCTSRNVTVGQALADADIHPSFIGNILMCVRTFPIRVGNIEEDGERVGYSGDVYPDQKELTWEELGQKAEITTVTKRVRRVFTWSNQQYANALQSIRPSHVFINFLNYMTGPAQFEDFLEEVENTEWAALARHPYKLFGFGPRNDQVYTQREIIQKQMNKENLFP